MEFRCSPYNSLLFFGFIGMLIFCSYAAPAQCQGDFSYKSDASETESGRIEINLTDTAPGVYTVNLYKMEGKIILVETREISSPEKIVFEELAPSNYYVKIEWGDSCRKILGGLEGIIIKGKDQGR